MNAIKLVLAVLLFSMSGCSGCGRGYSEGERAGVVTKFSRKGYTYKSWEGQLNLGGMTQDSDGHVVPNVWEFTVVDESVVPKVQEALSSGKRVTLRYVQWAVQPVSMDTSYEVVEVK